MRLDFRSSSKVRSFSNLSYDGLNFPQPWMILCLDRHPLPPRTKRPSLMTGYQNLYSAQRRLEFSHLVPHLPTTLEINPVQPLCGFTLRLLLNSACIDLYSQHLVHHQIISLSCVTHNLDMGLRGAPGLCSWLPEGILLGLSFGLARRTKILKLSARRWKLTLSS